jgi:multimeric flavodoxin WrbA
MKITILNGNPTNSAFDGYLGSIKGRLEQNGHSVTLLQLRDMPLRYCIGCWGCWVKTPGQCISQDASVEMDRAVIQADFVLWASPLKMGFTTELLKRACDKHLPLIHPYMVVDHGEGHHRKRYGRYPRVGLLVEKESQTDARDLEIVTDIHLRTALNLKTRLEFCLTTETPVEEIARRIETRPAQPMPLPGPLPTTTGTTITPPTRLSLFNGSPRGKRGNTPIFLREIAAGFGGPVESFDLVRLKETEAMVQAFANAECILFGFPLYTDSMPGIVKHYIEALEPLVGHSNPPIGFVVQSGFPEGLHSRYVERYLEKLADRLGSPYLGTVVKGNGEGVRSMPAEANAKLFADLRLIGSSLRTKGWFDASAMSRIAVPERFPVLLGPVFRVFLNLPVAHGYFDAMLKKNGVFERRFDQPFAPEKV